MTAPGTMIEMAAQSWSPAALNRPQHFQLLIAQPSAVRCNEAVPMSA